MGWRIDRVSKFTYVEFHDRTRMLNGAAFLLTDNVMAFAATSPRTGAGSLASGAPHHQNIGNEIALLERLRVTPVSHFVIGRPVDVMKNWTGQSLFRQQPHVFYVVAGPQPSKRPNKIPPLAARCRHS